MHFIYDSSKFRYITEHISKREYNIIVNAENIKVIIQQQFQGQNTKFKELKQQIIEL